ncbi:glycine-rich protein [Crocinitomix algicola]|uniref:glycine-rich protein n=1 Tax=Crocinitomix algicola TaxID=1740263 RepID=UPI0008726BB3|nr:glycine-rich protein [Crocinitomix algicola]
MKLNSTLKMLMVLFCHWSFNSLSQVLTFSYTGEVQTYVVPAGVSNIQIEAWGAQGGGSEVCGGTTEDDGGFGGYAVGSLSVTPGTELHIYVGGKPEIGSGSGVPGGFNGGGASGQWGGAGGGASDVRIGGTELEDRIIVAGGGGGGNTGCPDHGTGGLGGGLIGGDGIGLSGYTGGGGGTAVAGGAGAGDGSGGVLGVGGTGGYHVAGGGGGYYGGGAAYAAGGGGGSSYLGDLEEASTSAGIREGHGEVVITVLCVALELEEYDEHLCLGEEVTLEGISATGGTVMWDEGVENGVPFVPGGVGTYFYNGVSTSGSDCMLTVEIEVHESPDIVANASPEIVCHGQELILHGSGGAYYSWEPGEIEDDEPFIPELGTHVFTVIGEDWHGCTGTDEIEVSVIESPEITANVSSENICLGDEVTLSGSGGEIYEWDPEIEDGVAFVPGEIGTYTYSLVGYVDEDGCPGEDEVTFSVHDLPVIDSYTTADEMAGGDGEIDITVSGGAPGYLYDWDNDGTGDFDDSEDLTGLDGGLYTVVVQDENGCEVSSEIEVNSQLSINDIPTAQVLVFPNPTTSAVQIQFNGRFDYQVLTVDGKVLLMGNGFNNIDVNLEDFSSGTYLLEIMSNNQLFHSKIIKE